MTSRFGRAALGCWLSGVFLSPVWAEEEFKRVIDRLLAPPTIRVEAGFTASVLVPPGQLYDPLFLLPREGVIWLNDDGGEENDKGSRLLSVDRGGAVSVLAGLGKLLPVTGFDVAPADFGEFAGQIFTLAQAQVAMEGVTANHIIQRVDPKRGYAASVFCTLPPAGQVNQGISGVGVEARFGPVGTPFAGKFYAVTAYNNTIYQVTPDRTCTPFVTFPEQVGAPFGVVFSRDGQSLLVAVTRGGLLGPPRDKREGTIVRVRPNGTVEETPLARGLAVPSGMDFAPAGFGAYAGQLFVGDAASLQIPVPMTQPLNADGKVYRVPPEGGLQLVASGFFNPVAVRFIGDRLWVTDINGDFIAGRRELPDGFIVEIRAQ